MTDYVLLYKSYIYIGKVSLEKIPVTMAEDAFALAPWLA
jgi:hypothetical protein